MKRLLPERRPDDDVVEQLKVELDVLEHLVQVEATVEALGLAQSLQHHLTLFVGICAPRTYRVLVAHVDRIAAASFLATHSL